MVTFFSGCLPRTPLREQVAAAAAAGFDGLTIWPNVWRHARQRDGMSLAAMRDLFQEHGLTLEAVEWTADWVPPVADLTGGMIPPAAFRAEVFEVASALGATTVVAAHAPGGEADPDRDAASFAHLCDEAAGHGLRVALEFVPFTGLPDLPAATTLLAAAGRANAGLVVDVWHLARSGGTAVDLRGLDPASVLLVQLADGPTRAADDLAREAASARLLPGDGELDVAGCLAVLAELGVRAPTGPEVHLAEWRGLPAAAPMAQLFAATTRVLPRDAPSGPAVSGSAVSSSAVSDATTERFRT
ncbi:Xylose isomerase [Frankia canadensis]|uniref:Xylose isomerase n=1 Tax=Frankia canadensis TaxID=1836972 RepID=A0A2I2KMF9_9ACTN|nr:sugar phosphate isomerase/epimerase [Frankia canadensis]SNQ46850.1 Xylose isomerase [Frankia canadensis]SOU54140.1 Xylose isomerase [Frankia canadensis]